MKLKNLNIFGFNIGYKNEILELFSVLIFSENI